MNERHHDIDNGPIVPDEAVDACDTMRKTDHPRGVRIDADMPYKLARRRLLDEFDRTYCGEVLARFGGNVALAAAAAGIHRVHFYKILRRRGRTNR